MQLKNDIYTLNLDNTSCAAQTILQCMERYEIRGYAASGNHAGVKNIWFVIDTHADVDKVEGPPFTELREAQHARAGIILAHFLSVHAEAFRP